MPEELETILRLVADGTLTPEQAAPIIDALSEADRYRRPHGVHAHGETPEGGERRGRHLRIRVTERGRQVVNLRIPLAFAEMAGRMVPGIDDESWGRIRQAVANNVVGPIIDVDDPDGDGVRISVE